MSILIPENTYILTNGLSLGDCLMSPILDGLSPYVQKLYNTKTNLFVNVSNNFKVFDQRVLGFTYTHENGNRTVTFDLESKRALTDTRLFRIKLKYDPRLRCEVYIMTYRGSEVTRNFTRKEIEHDMYMMQTGIRHTLVGAIIDKYS